MSENSVFIRLEPGAEGTGVFPVVLKKIMEMPPPNILEGDDGESPSGHVYQKINYLEDKSNFEEM